MTSQTELEDPHSLARLVLAYHPGPRNMTDAAVVLESAGYVDEVARRLGYANTFSLAKAVDQLVPLYQDLDPQPHVAESDRLRPEAADYLKGLGYSLPWLLSVVVLFWYRVALWAAFANSMRVASVVSLAFFVSTLLAGAISQVLAKRGFFYLAQGNERLLKWAMARFLAQGSALAVFVIALSYRLFVAGYYPKADGFIYLEFALAILAFQLSLAPLYMLRRVGYLALATGLALAITVAATKYLWPIAGPASLASAETTRAQLLGLAVGAAAAFTFAFGRSLLTREQRRAAAAEQLPKRAALKPPSWRIVTWLSVPYGAYGAAYFALIFADRLVAGYRYSQTLGVGHYLYPASYEAATDLALLTLLPLIGMVFALIESFGRRFALLASSVRLSQPALLSHALKERFTREMASMASLGLVVGALAPYAIVALSPSTLTAPLSGAHGQPYRHALQLAALAYSLLPTGLLASQYLMFLGRPLPPLIAALLGAAVSAVIGLWLSRPTTTWTPALGLICGVVVFVGYTALSARANQPRARGPHLCGVLAPAVWPS